MKRNSAEAGFNMVILMVAVTVMSIAVAAALPLWSAQMKREREEELVFRGLQYAEAIRVFQKRFGRFPLKLKELIEVKPRCIRQLWKDPMTDSMNWGLIIAGGGRSSIPVGGPQGRPGIPGRPGIGGNPGNPATGVGQPGDGDKQPDLPQGPIKGVFSRSTDESLRLFFDHDHYNQWQFTVDLVTAPFGVNGGHGGGVRPGLPGQGQPGGGLPRFDVQWIGRPFRPGLTSPSAGGHGLQPSDLGGKGPRAGGFGAPSARPSGDGS